MSDKETVESFKTQVYLIQAAINGFEILTKPKGSAECKFIVKPFNEYFDFFHQDYRVATPIAEDIDWSGIDKKYRWVAVETNGEVYAYNKEPYFEDGFWRVEELRGSEYTRLLNAHKRGGEFAIFKRPVEKVERPGTLREFMSSADYSVIVEYTLTDHGFASTPYWKAKVFHAHDDNALIDDIGGTSIGENRDELISKIKKQLEKLFTKPKEDLKKLYDWFCDEDGDTPTVEMCIQRIEEMRRAETVLRGFVHDYNKNQLFLNQHQFPIEDNVTTPPAV